MCRFETRGPLALLAAFNCSWVARWDHQQKNLGTRAFSQRTTLEMSYFAFFVSAALAALGMFVAIQGILAEQWKPAMVGFVLLLGAGVFATLCLATRRKRTDRMDG